MMFAEVEFVFFLPLVFAVAWLGPRRLGWQNGVLLVASLAFYATWQVRLLPLLLAGTAIDFAIGVFLGRSTPAPVLQRRAALGLSLLVNVGTLGFFKYAGFFAATLDQVLAAVGLAAPLPILRLLLPLGLSFYTLQRLGYIIDVYYGRMEPCRNPLTFAVFTAFFPQITAGPISRGRELLPQLERVRTLSPEDLAAGGSSFLAGFMLKAFAADIIGRELVDPVFTAPANFTAAAHWTALVGYAGQVFADFAGYSLMAIGCARVLGIQLPQNFNMPFASTSLLEFWRRWHITLNRWLFDYLYGPLTTGRGVLRGRYALCLMLVMLVSGLWHGAQWTFLAWGAFHGVGLLVNQRWVEFWRGLMRRDRRWRSVQQSFAYGTAALVATQLWFVLSLVLFRSPSLGTAATFAAGLLRGGTESIDLGDFSEKFSLLVAIGMIVVSHGPATRIGARALERFHRMPEPVRGLVYGLVLVFLAIMTPVSTGTFIYRQF